MSFITSVQSSSEQNLVSSFVIKHPVITSALTIITTLGLLLLVPVTTNLIMGTAFLLMGSIYLIFKHSISNTQNAIDSDPNRYWIADDTAPTVTDYHSLPLPPPVDSEPSIEPAPPSPPSMRIEREELVRAAQKPLQMNPRHFRESLDLNQASRIFPEGVDPANYSVNRLLPLFDGINTTDSSEEDYINPSDATRSDWDRPISYTDARRHLTTLVGRINNRTRHTGVPHDPAERDEFYNNLELLGKYLVYKLSSPEFDSDAASRRNRSVLLLRMAESGSHCGSRWMREFHQIYQQLSPENTLTLPEKINLRLQNARMTIASSLGATNIIGATRSDTMVSPHSVNNYVHALAISRGITRFVYHDPYGSPVNLASAQRRFDAIYTPAYIANRLIEMLEGEVGPTGARINQVCNRDDLMDWFRQHIPDDFEPDNEDVVDRQMNYIQAYVYDFNSGNAATFKGKALCYFLRRIGVLAQ